MNTDVTRGLLEQVYAHWDAHDAIARCDECWPQWVKLSFTTRIQIGEDYERLRKAGVHKPAPVEPWEHVGHNPVQHRDGKPPWCNACGWTSPVPAVMAKAVKGCRAQVEEAKDVSEDEPTRCVREDTHHAPCYVEWPADTHLWCSFCQSACK